MNTHQFLSGRCFHPILAVFRSWIFLLFMDSKIIKNFREHFWDFVIPLSSLHRKDFWDRYFFFLFFFFFFFLRRGKERVDWMSTKIKKKKIDRVVNKISARSRKRIHQLQRQNKIIGEILFATIVISGDKKKIKTSEIIENHALHCFPSIQRLESQHEN